jgi:hypothetical protein
MAERSDVESSVGSLLVAGRFRDYGPNGPHGGGEAAVRKIVCAADASQPLVETAIGACAAV